MSRISRLELNIKIAHLISQRATCERAHVGCIITQNNRIISSGYNGPILGHGCKELGCNLTESCLESTHAEMNAITHASKYGIPLKDAKLYCTHAPCKNCSMAIIQSGISEVYYDKDYHNHGLELLIKSGIKVERYAECTEDN